MSMAESMVYDQARDEIREWLIDQVENRGVTLSTIAVEAEVSRTSLSLFYHGHRPASKELRDKLIKTMNKSSQTSSLLTNAEPPELKAETKKPEAKANHINASALPPISTADIKPISRINGLLATEDLRQVLGLCSMCMEDGEIGVVIGQAGAGKTTALREYCRRESRAIYIRADITMSAKEVLVEIGSGLGIDLYGSRHNMGLQIIRKLKTEPTIVIIDEADLLISRESINKLEIIRNIWDEAHMGLVLAGPPRLATFLVKGPGGRENLSQFYSRVRRAYTMKGVSREEAMGCLAGVPIDQEAARYLVTAAISKANGGLRRFSRLLQNSLDLTEPEETITLAIVKEADSLLVSPRSLGLEF